MGANCVALDAIPRFVEAHNPPPAAMFYSLEGDRLKPGGRTKLVDRPDTGHPTFPALGPVDCLDQRPCRPPRFETVSVATTDP